MRKYMTTVIVSTTLCCFGLHIAPASDNHKDTKADLELSAEVQALRSDVRELRADINRLIEYLKSDKSLPTQVETSQSSEARMDQVLLMDKDKTEFVDLTLDKCIALAFQNAGQKGSESEQCNLKKDVHDAYWDLWAATKRIDVARNSRDNALELWRLCGDRSRVGEKDVKAEAHARALYKQFETQITEALYGSREPGHNPLGLYAHEMLLRQKIGLAVTDGRLIRPTEEPIIAPFKFEWGKGRDVALRSNPRIRDIQSKINRLELALSSAKKAVRPQLDVDAFERWLKVGEESARANTNDKPYDYSASDKEGKRIDDNYAELSVRLEFSPLTIGTRRALAGIRNLQVKLVSLNEQLREAELLVIDNLAKQWRKSESTFNSINDIKDQLQANVDEIKIYRDHMDQNKAQLGQVIDPMLRSEERRNRASLQYFEGIGEYRKAVFAVQWWSGSVNLLDAVLRKSDHVLQPVEVK